MKNPAVYGCRLQGFQTDQRFAVSRSDIVYLFTGIYRCERHPKSHVCEMKTETSSTERTSVELFLNKLPGPYVKQTLKTKSYCTVSITIANLVMVKTQILLLFLLIKCTILDIQDAACLNFIQILQHPISRPTTKSTHNTLANTPKQNVSTLVAGTYGRSTTLSK